jgi:DNA mismatch endonuclease, patch repair protein
MAAVRSTNNRYESALRRELFRRGLRYRLYAKDLPGRPDLTFPRFRAVLFVDSDFWHGRLVREQGTAALKRSVRSANRDSYWLPKLSRNIERDDYISAILRERGWLVLRIWESDIRRDLHAVAERVVRELRRRELVLARRTSA